ncbi:MAG: alpha/beta hydrolase, partial [Pseudomonadota bacterium]
MAKGLGLVLLSMLAIYTGFCGVLYAMQRHLLYYPTPKVERNDAEAIYLSNDLARIKVWKAGGENRHAVIYFGGNAEQVARKIPFFKQHLSGYDLYLMNYRGYGGSTGSPSETALYLDA